MHPTIAIGYDTEMLHSKAMLLAERYGFIISNQTLPRLHLTQDKLVLLAEGFTPLEVNFSTSTWQRRHDAGKKQGLIRACKPTPGMNILDATAGWGRDAAILASFGANVLMLERQPLMAALLEDAIIRAQSTALSLIYQDAKSYLERLTEYDYPDVIYIDPMHPERQKSALVKKDMQILQQLVGPDDDAQTLIQLAIVRAKKRVVVKWPQKESALVKPNLSIPGKTIRFDVYFPRV